MQEATQLEVVRHMQLMYLPVLAMLDVIAQIRVPKCMHI